jgi:hypothetical protein
MSRGIREKCGAVFPPLMVPMVGELVPGRGECVWPLSVDGYTIYSRRDLGESVFDILPPTPPRRFDDADPLALEAKHPTR